MRTTSFAGNEMLQARVVVDYFSGQYYNKMILDAMTMKLARQSDGSTMSTTVRHSSVGIQEYKESQ